ncbi:MAG: DUF4382 domain-containing protein [Fidelibacterota bacterium]|nr:MAG: DUF4382 domain-containing protein [Candidatus Neomarinimicrobiota bacterium]
MNRIIRFLPIAAAGVVLGAFFTSCESLWNDTGDGDTGTLSVELTDGPFPSDLVAEANITIDSLDIREKGAEDESGAYTTLSREQGTYNLMDLRNGVTESLAELDIPEGTYNQVRLYVSDAEVVLKDGQEFPLQVPSGIRTGLKIFIRPDIVVEKGITAELLLDIDVGKSFVVQGNSKGSGGITGFLFKPVLRAVNKSTTGRLVGTVRDTSAAANPIPDAQVWVWSTELDSVISNTFTDTLTGDYQLIGLEAGFYTAYATAAGHDTASASDVEIKAATATDLDFDLKLLQEL